MVRMRRRRRLLNEYVILGKGVGRFFFFFFLPFTDKVVK